MDHLEHWIDFTQTTGRAFCECRALRRHRSPTLATHPTLIFGCCVSLQMGPATLLLGILSSELMTFMLSFFPNWSYFDFWYSWTKMDERNRSFQWHNMAMENQTLEVVFAETPYPTCRMTIPSVFLVAFVCVMLWKQSSETHWNTWNLEDVEHLLWFTKKNDGCSKIIPFLHSPKKHAAQTAKHVSR